jgi:hypothetical protein
LSEQTTTKVSSRISTAALVGLCGFYLCIQPGFRFFNLFTRHPLTVEPLFLFPEKPHTQRLVPSRIKNALLGPWGTDGSFSLQLNGEKEGAVEILLPPFKSHFVTLRIDLISGGTAAADGALQTPARSVKWQLSRQTHLREGYFRLDNRVPPQEPSILSIRAHDGPAWLERLDILQTSKANAPPPVDVMLLVLFFISLVARSLPRTPHFQFHSILASGIPLLLASWGQIRETGVWASSWTWLALVIIGVWVRFLLQAGTAESRWMDVGLAILLLGLTLRWSRFTGSYLQPLEQDPAGYSDFAANLR